MNNIAIDLLYSNKMCKKLVPNSGQKHSQSTVYVFTKNFLKIFKQKKSFFLTYRLYLY